MSARRNGYIKLVWVNKETPLSAQNFNHMEEGIEINNELAKECANFLDEIKSAIIDQLFFSIDPSTKRVTLRFGTPAPEEGEEEQEGVYYTPNFFAEKVISFDGFCKTDELNLIANKKIELLEFNGFVSGTNVGNQIAEGEIKYCTSGSNEGVITNENEYSNVFLAKINGELTVVEPSEKTLYLEMSSYKIYKYKNVQSGDKLKQISSMILGTTEQTAYRGDRGNAHDQAINEIKNSYCEFSGVKDFLNGIRTYTISSYDEDGDFAVLASYDYEGYGWKLDNLNKIYAGNFDSTFVVMQTEDSTVPGSYVSGSCDCVRFMNLADPINNRDAANKQYVDGGLAGKADLVNGVVPASQLPSFVDDVIEFLKQVSGSSWLNSVLETTAGTRVFNNATAANLTGGTSSPYYKKFLINTDGTEAGLVIESPDSGKIYVSTDNANTYRWSGSNLVEISKSISLGETASTAYAGNKGKANAEAIAALQTAKADKTEVAAVQAKTRTITITQADWVNSAYSISLGTVVVGANDALFISPADSCAQDYYNAGIVRSISNDGSTLTLTAATTPTNSITIQLVYLKGEAF